MTSDKKFYEKTWFIILMLIIIPPVGIWLVIKKTKLSKLAKIIITIIFGIWTILEFAALSSSPQTTNVSPVQAKPVAQAIQADNKAAIDNKEIHTDSKPADTSKAVEPKAKPATPSETAKSQVSSDTTNKPAATKSEHTASTQSEQTTNTQNNSNNNDNSSNYQTGVIKTLGTGRYHAVLHSSPSSQSSGYDLDGGTAVTILGQSNNYYYVRLQDGSTGYVYEHYVSCN
ncbi:SH3 domain-containing protein [Clostridium mediterraneense]|uniref:SH3 domain-containing protein n=1 Tax=Clostridium mediterraneense TaxID=1805472 RepID=UPI00082C2E05|nr:SH3 domain-containing protein [Clostridium mediterraneense]